MALLATSCTMRNQPNRLLDKGPSYLRTRTNSKLFAGRRRSAVELLEASKPQYVKSNSALDGRPLSLRFSKSFSVFDRLDNAVTTTQRQRSKSEYNISSLASDSGSDGADDIVDGKIVASADKTAAPQPQQQNLACRRTLHKSTEAVQGKINMSERTCEISRSPTGSKPRGPDAKASVNSPVAAARDPQVSVSCQELGEMASNRPPQIMSTSQSARTGEIGGAVDSSQTGNTCTPVHRSHSDLNCRHVRDSSVASDNSSRYSRASADLENFFNQMGLERNVLDPMLRLQEVQGKKEFDMFESVSSLDSPDTRSICSGISRSEKGLSDTEGGDKSQHNSNVVERNARIIKWLCSVKKAKTNLPGQS